METITAALIAVMSAGTAGAISAFLWIVQRLGGIATTQAVLVDHDKTLWSFLLEERLGREIEKGYVVRESEPILTDKLIHEKSGHSNSSLELGIRSFRNLPWVVAADGDLPTLGRLVIDHFGMAQITGWTKQFEYDSDLETVCILAIAVCAKRYAV